MARKREDTPAALEYGKDSYDGGDAAVATPGRWTPPRWWIIPLGIILTLAVAWIVSGGLFPVMLLGWLQSILLVPIFLAAAMLGLQLTRPLAKTNGFVETGWPDAARLIMSVALGLGAIALAVLFAGSLHLLHGSVMVVILISAGAGGFQATRQFVAGIDRAALKQSLPRGLLIVLLAAVPIAMLFIASTYPPGVLWKPNGYDVQEYHLQLPREYLAANSTAPVEHNVYSFLPAVVEMLYLMVMSLSRMIYGTSDVIPAILPATLLHAAMAVLAAGAVALSPVKLTGFARSAAFVLVLAVPWTIMAGSLAFDDAGVLLFGALAVGLCMGARTRVPMIMIGLLLGLAVGCKMTSGVMIALPIAAVLLARGRLVGLLLATVVAIGVYSPWAVRSMVASHTPEHLGNPVFPIAAERLGLGTWTTDQARRWTLGHEPQPLPDAQKTTMGALRQRLRAFRDEILFNAEWSPNYQTVLKWSEVKVEPPATLVGHWLQDMGWMWFIFPAALAAALSRGRTGWRLLLILGVQTASWMLFTHLQARFFLPAIIPVALLMALGSARLTTAALLVGAGVGLQALLCGFLLLPSPKLFLGPQSDLARTADFAELFRSPDILLPPQADGKRVDLPEDICTYLVGDPRALYYHGKVLYHTVWDVDPLVETYKEAGADAAIKYLHTHHVQYVVVNWDEVDRLRRTYGFDPAVTPEMFNELEKSGLEMMVMSGDRIVLYRVK